MVTDVTGMSGLRVEVSAKKISPINTFLAYSEIIADQDNVFQAEAASMTATVASSQGLGLISAVNAREDLSEQDAVLAGALAAHSLTGPDRAAFGQAAGRQFEDTQLYQKLLSPDELTAFNATMNKMAPATIQTNLTKVQDAVEADIPLAAMEQQGLSSVKWQLLTGAWQKANYDAASNAAATTLGIDEGLAVNAKNRVWETAGVGLTGLILTLIVSLLLSRSINRRLATLRRSALTLAQEQLPSVVARLRRGESVDVAAEAPPLSVGSDEIGQVGQAIDTVRQTAIRSAIDEARVRQGVNDMFRNLARRNQSLLQRQLTVLDEAERRATDPDVLEDLFKMDHLTTRMRRHAEGLIILSGAPPGRSWSAPVKLIDVMRGAVAEVEDYARVNAATQSRAALAGSAGHRRDPPARRADRERDHPLTAVHAGSGQWRDRGQRVRDRDRGPRPRDGPAADAGAQRAAGEPAGHQPGQHRAAWPVRRRAAGKAARDQGHAPPVALRRHDGRRADPARADRRGRPRGDHLGPTRAGTAGANAANGANGAYSGNGSYASGGYPRRRGRGGGPARAAPGRAATGCRAGQWPPRQRRGPLGPDRLPVPRLDGAA